MDEKSVLSAKTLKEAELEIKDRDYEVGVVVGRNGQILYKVVGKEHSVDILSKIVKGNIFTHNHPGGICAFSQGDIVTFIADGGYELRVVTRDGRFISLKEKLGIPSGADLAEAFIDAGFNNVNLYKIADLRAMERYGRGNYRLKQINEESENIVNEWFRENAGKHGFDFTEGTL